MKTHKVRTLLTTVAMIVLWSAILPAQQQPPQKGEMKSMGNMSMEGMMKECHERHQAMTKAVDQMSKTLEDAQQSNDAAKMKAAINQAQKQLTNMKEHMSKCDSMMKMMENMQGEKMK